MITFTRLYTGEDHKSHFDEKTVEMSDALYGKMANPFTAKDLYFGSIGKENISWHNAPKKQFVVYLEGTVEMEVGSGEKRQFQAGDIVLAEDLEGEGHITRILEEGGLKYLAIPVD